MDHDSTHLYHFDLPDDLIATHPVAQRESSRLLVYERGSKRIDHLLFHDLPDLLSPEDLVVLNNSRVIPARMHGRKSSGGRVEVFVLDVDGEDESRWSVSGQRTLTVMVRSSKFPKPGSILHFEWGDLVVGRRLEDGLVEVSGHFPDGVLFALTVHGELPIPPYLLKRREQVELGSINDNERYQTIYAKRPGSVAAPTAGLHFTDGVFSALDARGIRRAEVTLEVGAGTFRPVSTAKLSEHVMHSERYEITKEASRQLQTAKRIMAVGTTTARVLESEIRLENPFSPGRRSTDIFLKPDNPPRAVDSLLTNFHLPCSTLLALVASFVGVEAMHVIYEEAIGERYRFYSYGDAMLIL